MALALALGAAPAWAQEEDDDPIEQVAPTPDPEVPAPPPTEPPAEAPPERPAPPAAEAPVEEPPVEATVRGLSWDIEAGGVPATGALLEAQLGFSTFRAAYHHSLGNGMSVGGMVGLDYGFWAPRRAFDPALILAAPIRYSLVHRPTFSIGLRADPGLGFWLQDGAGVAVLLNVGARLGVILEHRVIVGAGMDIPMALELRSGRTANLTFPILAGPFAEFHITPPLAVTLDTKVGPHLNSSGGQIFGLRILAGVAYRL